MRTFYRFSILREKAFFIRSNTSYTHGIKIKLNAVEVTSPPITAIAIGERSDPPSPKVNAIGNKAKIVVKLVIMMGRIRCCPASTIASVKSIPDAFNWLMRSTKIMALLTAIPESITIPITPMILIVVPVSQNSITAPTNATGIVNNIVNGCNNDSNCDAITM